MAKKQPVKVTALDKLNFEILQKMGGHAGILRGWAEISGFLRVSKRTAMRYYQFRGMPVSYITKSPITTPFLLSMWIGYLGNTRAKKQASGVAYPGTHA